MDHEGFPKICLPDSTEKSPIGLIFCIAYLLGVGAVAGAAIFLYLKEKRLKNGNQNNCEFELKKREFIF